MEKFSFSKNFDLECVYATNYDAVCDIKNQPDLKLICDQNMTIKNNTIEDEIIITKI